MTTSPIKELKELLAVPAPAFVCEVTPYGFEKTTAWVETTTARLTASRLGLIDVLELIAEVEKQRHT